MITFEQIQQANEGLKAINVKGKRYVMVNEKVKAFRKLYPQGFIRTDLLSLENGVAVMQSKAGYYDDGTERILGTGLAFEKQDSSFLNKTSFIENCETSAIGRALSFLGLGMDDSIASAEELANAILNQDKQQEESGKQTQEEPKQFTRPQRNNVKVTTSSKVPNNAVQEYIGKELVFMGQMFGIADKAEMLEKFKNMRSALIRGGVIEDIPSEQQTLEQAEKMFEAIYANFRPSGEQK